MRWGFVDEAVAPVRRGAAIHLASGLAALAVGLCMAVAAQAQTKGDASLVARGEYLTRAADCASCHTAPGGEPFAGGLAFKLPFGTIYSPNITADKAHGIGTWTDDEFVRALHEGIGKGGRHLYPAMPYPSYTLMSREDALAIKAYLFSLPPVQQANHRSELVFPFNQRYLMAFWNLLFSPNHRFEQNTQQSAAWNRGAYLVEALGHCGECHTPRSFTQALDNSQKFAGAVAQGWTAYNITQDKESGIGGWSDEALAAFLTSGHAEGHSAAAGPMGEVVANSLRYLTKADISAIVTYLKTIKPIHTVAAVTANPPAKQSPTAPVKLDDLGARTFAGVCANCHLWDGTGAQTPNATLIGNRTVNDPKATNLVQVMIEGVNHLDMGQGPVFMPPFASHSDEQLAALANFVNHRFGSGNANVQAVDIRHARAGNVEPIPGWWLWVGLTVAVVIAALILRLIVWLIATPFRRRRA
jgi:mono/diheme cytochrome c family protein